MRCAEGHHLPYVPRAAHMDLRRLPVAAAELHLDERAARKWGKNRVVCMRFFLFPMKQVAWQGLTKARLLKGSTTTHACINQYDCGFSHSCFILTAVHRVLYLMPNHVVALSAISGVMKTNFLVPECNIMIAGEADFHGFVDHLRAGTHAWYGAEPRCIKRGFLRQTLLRG